MYDPLLPPGFKELIQEKLMKLKLCSVSLQIVRFSCYSKKSSEMHLETFQTSMMEPFIKIVKGHNQLLNTLLKVTLMLNLDKFCTSF